MAEEFSDWLRGQLERKGISQAEVARRLKISPSAISRWLNESWWRVDFDPFHALERLFARHQRRAHEDIYPKEGELAGLDCPGCGRPMKWIYGYKRRRPRARCLDCEPL